MLLLAWTAVIVCLSVADGTQFYPLDACADVQLCDQLPDTFNVSGVYHVIQDSTRVMLMCHMERGRWTEVLRRGEDINGDDVAVAKSFSSSSIEEQEMASGFQVDALAGEFYMGHTFLQTLASVYLRVELRDTENIRYFSVFNNFALTEYNELSDGFQYFYGTAGDGDFPLLRGAAYNAVCSPAVWWSTSGVCDATTSAGPFLTLPLDGADHRGGNSYPWPGLQRQLRAVSLLVRSSSSEFCSGLEELAFSADVIQHVETNLFDQHLGEESFSMSCIDSSLMLPTELTQHGALANSVTLQCSVTKGILTLNDWPMVRDGSPCIENCGDGMIRYFGDFVYDGRAQGRVTCLSAVSSDAVVSVMDAALHCGQLNMQLLDFVPPESSLRGDPAGKRIITALRRGEESEVLLDSRGGTVTTVSQSVVRTVQYYTSLQYNTGAPVLISREFHLDSSLTASYYYVCMDNVGCEDGGLFYLGFCYYLLEDASASNHEAKCRERYQGSSAEFSADLIEKMSPRLVASTANPLLGVYKRDGVYYAAGGVAVNRQHFESGSYGADDQRCVYVSNKAPHSLMPVSCSDQLVRGVICQNPGYSSGMQGHCTIPYSELSAAGSAVGGVTVSWTRVDNTREPGVEGDQVRLSCPAGHVFNSSTPSASATLSCAGPRDEWVPAQDSFSWPTACVFACEVPTLDSTTADVYLNGTTLVYMCTANLSTSSGVQEQTTVCNNDARDFVPAFGELLPCQTCRWDPLSASDTYTSDWTEGASSHLINATVTYTCQPHLTTDNDTTVQTQTCSHTGWDGVISECSRCIPPDLNGTLLSPVSSSAAAVLYTLEDNLGVRCPEGLSSADGVQNDTLICLATGWQRTHLQLNCTHCVGAPENVSDVSTMSRIWSGDSALDSQAEYRCSAGLETLSGLTNQVLRCSAQGGWETELAPCQMCTNAPNASHPTVAKVTATGAGTLGSSLVFHCRQGLSAVSGLDNITSVCAERGWNTCQQDIVCPFCTSLPSASEWGGTFHWDYNGTNTYGTVVTATCNSGMATEDGLLTEQTLRCGEDGWNSTQLQPCTVCLSAPPAAHETMLPNISWSLGETTAEYRCRDNTRLPWLQNTYSMPCTPTGWLNCTPECSACYSPDLDVPGVYLDTVNVQRDGEARFRCISGLQTAFNTTTQTLLCQFDGVWLGNVSQCDRCIGDPPPADSNQLRSWNGTVTLYSVAEYRCNDSRTTSTGTSLQTVECTNSGWTAAPLPCNHCLAPPEVEHPVSQSRQWDGSSVEGSTVLYGCIDGAFMRPDVNLNETGPLQTNSTNQTLVCTDQGWQGEIRDCVSCLEGIPHPGNGSEERNVTWEGQRYEGSQVLYTCGTGLVQTVSCLQNQWIPAVLDICGYERTRCVCERGSGGLRDS